MIGEGGEEEGRGGRDLSNRADTLEQQAGYERLMESIALRGEALGIGLKFGGDVVVPNLLGEIEGELRESSGQSEGTPSNRASAGKRLEVEKERREIREKKEEDKKGKERGKEKKKRVRMMRSGRGE